jgi:hypothetical protein
MCSGLHPGVDASVDARAATRDITPDDAALKQRDGALQTAQDRRARLRAGLAATAAAGAALLLAATFMTIIAITRGRRVEARGRRYAPVGLGSPRPPRC